MKKITVALLCVMLHALPAFALTEVRRIPTRPGVTLDFLITLPEPGQGRDALILFPGGNGVRSFQLLEDGAVQGWNFLVRSSPEFSSHGLTVVTVNPPSDHPNGMSTGFRESPEHARDVGMLVSYLESQGIARIFLAGNSRGTISVAALAAQLADSHIKGIILTSSLDYDNFMRWLPLENIRTPVLMVHNREDACRVSEFSEAQKTGETLRGHTEVAFVEVSGGATPMSLPCDNLSTHGFFGIESRVVRVITDWIDGRKVPERVD